jgi:uncharacterized protein (TIGR03435 family)
MPPDTLKAFNQRKAVTFERGIWEEAGIMEESDARRSMNLIIRILSVAASLSLLPSCGIALATRQAVAEPPQFEVVSIRPSKPEGGPIHTDVTADGVRFTNTPLLWGMLMAYGPSSSEEFAYFTDSLVIGGPDWMRTDRYDIDAHIPEANRAAWQNPATQRPLLRAMLQAMYADRCKLAVHRGQKDAATFSLLVAKGGAKLKPTDPTAEHPAGINLPGGAVLVPGRGSFTFYNAPMSALAVVLSNLAGRPVQDMTGLAGRFDFAFDRGPSMTSATADTPDAGPSLFSTLPQQIGLRLESHKAMVETLVVDHLERPTEN